jgi:hypothetical protein
MPARLLSCVAALSFLLAPAQVRPADDQPKKTADQAQSPTLVVRIKSISDLISDSKYLAALAGQEDKVDQGERILKDMVDDHGLKGIDIKRPLGLYGSLSPLAGVALIPVADEKTLLEALEQFAVKAEKGEDGIYSVKSEAFPIPIPVYLKFANKYAYVTAQNKSALKDKLLDPETVLSSVRPAMISTRFHIDQIPEMPWKEMAIGHIELQSALQQERKVPGETKAQAALRAQMIKSVSDHALTLVKQGGEVEAFFDVDRKANQLVAEFSVAGKPGSNMSKALADLGQSRSMFAGLAGNQAALNVLVHLALPEELRKSFQQVIHEGLHKGLANEKDEAKREQAKKLLHALEPTIKAGELDAAVTLRRPSDAKHYTLVVGVKVKDGQGIETALEDFIQNLPETDREKIKPNIETVGDVKVHRIEAQKDFDEQARQLLGENPVFMAIRADGIVLAAGERGLEALKSALTIEPKSGPQIEVEVSMASMAPTMAHGDANALKELQKAAATAFKGAKDGDKIRFTLEGGKTLKARFTMDAAVATFISQVSQNPALKDFNKPAKKKAAKKSDDD